ncbi:hypothetical protein D3C85_1784250 [compost metagenome]
MVSASTTAMSDTEPSWAIWGPLAFLKWSRLALAASASNLAPSLKVTSVRRSTVSLVLLSLYFHAVASMGLSLPSGSRRIRLS